MPRNKQEKKSQKQTRSPRGASSEASELTLKNKRRAKKERPRLSLTSSLPLGTGRQGDSAAAAAAARARIDVGARRDGRAERKRSNELWNAALFPTQSALYGRHRRATFYEGDDDVYTAVRGERKKGAGKGGEEKSRDKRPSVVFTTESVG